MVEHKMSFTKLVSNYASENDLTLVVHMLIDQLMNDGRKILFKPNQKIQAMAEDVRSNAEISEFQAGSVLTFDFAKFEYKLVGTDLIIDSFMDSDGVVHRICRESIMGNEPIKQNYSLPLLASQIEIIAESGTSVIVPKTKELGVTERRRIVFAEWLADERRRFSLPDDANIMEVHESLTNELGYEPAFKWYLYVLNKISPKLFPSGYQDPTTLFRRVVPELKPSRGARYFATLQT